MKLSPGMAPKGEPQSFDEYLLRVNPTGEALANLADQPDETPVIMLNLLRFRPRGDAYIYKLYGQDAGPEVTKTNSYIGFFGLTIRDLDPAFGLSVDWDGIVLPIYQRRKAFLQLQRSPAYQRAIPLRTAGTFSRLLYVLKDPEITPEGSVNICDLNASGEPILTYSNGCLLLEQGRLRDGTNVGSLAEYAAAMGRALLPFGGKLRLQTETEVPIVSEDRWDFCLISEFPSQQSLVDYLASASASEISETRKELCGHSLLVAANSTKLPK